MAPEIIVLTGTITPRAPFTAYADAAVRRSEYLDALKFYRQFARVVFLENSGFALRQDEEFAALPDCELWEMPVSEHPQRGKGYQEFEMLEGWLNRLATQPASFIKITGRYRYLNFAALINDCRRAHPAPLVIDLHPRSCRALTSIFASEVAFFQSRLAGLYQDERGLWVEHALFRRLALLPANGSRAFGVEPRLAGRSGSTGETLAAPEWKYRLKQTCRAVNLRLDERRLWYAH
jgi:hypothetical protein